MYKHLENKMCKELEALEEKYRTDREMSEGDLRRIDILAHALKSMAAYREKKMSEEYNGMNGNSYMSNSYANNSYANNSYMNNSGMNNSGMNNPGNSYANSYANSYMRDGRFTSRDMEMSGHYPPVYPEDRRW